MKQLASAFTIDTIVQVLFGIKVDSLIETTNPIIHHAKKLFTNNLTVRNIFEMLLILLFPKVAKFLGIRIYKEVIEYFQKISSQIIETKRAELSEKGNLGTARNFIEMMIESDFAHANSADNPKQMSKCKFLFLYSSNLEIFYP